MEETDKIIKAQQARGADFESGNLLSRAKALIPILIPLFISSFAYALRSGVLTPMKRSFSTLGISAD
jgi:energy-coupling factor transporter transmembrane protein EcfT